MSNSLKEPASCSGILICTEILLNWRSFSLCVSRLKILAHWRQPCLKAFRFKSGSGWEPYDWIGFCWLISVDAHSEPPLSTQFDFGELRSLFASFHIFWFRGIKEKCNEYSGRFQYQSLLLSAFIDVENFQNPEDDMRETVWTILLTSCLLDMKLRIPMN